MHGRNMNRYNMSGHNLLLTLTEGGMILYWGFASLMALDVLMVAPEYMYWDYANPSMVAWNWSFYR